MFSCSAYIMTKLRYGNFCSRPMSAYTSNYTYPVISKKKQIAFKNNSALRKPSNSCESNSIFYNGIAKQITSYMSRSGSKANARALLEECYEIIKRTQLERFNFAQNDEIVLDAEDILSLAVENCKPVLLLAPIKRGGVKYNVPVPASIKKSYFLAMKWLLDSAREKERSVHLPTKLAWEIMDAAYERGRIITKKTDLHRQCEENRAYAHYRFG